MPLGCEITYDLKVIDIIRSLLRPKEHAAELEAFYLDFRTKNGRRPSAVELFRNSHDPRATGHGSWFDFVRDMGDPMPERPFATHGRLLKQVERQRGMPAAAMSALLEVLAGRQPSEGAEDLALNDYMIQGTGGLRLVRADTSGELEPLVRELIEWRLAETPIIRELAESATTFVGKPESLELWKRYFVPDIASFFGEDYQQNLWRMGIKTLPKKKIMILGGGPNRIGQGIEFDYCCVHASFALREIGYESVMVNSNPETVSTDYDTSDRLYFEPLTLEDVLEIYQQEKCDGAIVQFGGQTPLNLATALKANGVNIIGTSPESIEMAEDRKQFSAILDKAGLKSPANRTAMNEVDALKSAHEIGFPVLLRPSFVLGGRGMFIVYSEEEFRAVVRQAFDVMPDKPVLIDKFLEDAIELDVDCISDGETSVIGGMLEHIEYAGVHSGDAAMVMPPHTLSKEMLNIVRKATYELARELKVIGLMNVQFAIKDNLLYVLEVNPRASRTVPFVAKAIGVPLAKLAAKVMTGAKLKDLGFTREQTPKHWCVKEAVFPFVRFPGATIALGPEMRSTGEVMGLDDDLGVAFAKAQAAAKPGLPVKGNVFLSVKDADKKRAVEIARGLEKLGFAIYSTSGTAKTLTEGGVNVKRLAKIQEGRPNAVDLIKNGQIQMVINTPGGMVPRRDENAIRSAAYAHNVCIMTTITGAEAAMQGIRALKEKHVGVKPIQRYHGNVNVI